MNRNGNHPRVQCVDWDESLGSTRNWNDLRNWRQQTPPPGLERVEEVYVPRNPTSRATFCAPNARNTITVRPSANSVVSADGVRDPDSMSAPVSAPASAPAAALPTERAVSWAPSQSRIPELPAANNVVSADGVRATASAPASSPAAAREAAPPTERAVTRAPNQSPIPELQGDLKATDAIPPHQPTSSGSQGRQEARTPEENTELMDLFPKIRELNVRDVQELMDRRGNVKKGKQLEFENYVMEQTLNGGAVWFDEHGDLDTTPKY